MQAKFARFLENFSGNYHRADSFRKDLTNVIYPWIFKADSFGVPPSGGR